MQNIQRSYCFCLQTVNFDLTRGYLDLIVTYFCIMILVSRVEDRKAVLGLFNFAFELQHGKTYVSLLYNSVNSNSFSTGLLNSTYITVAP